MGGEGCEAYLATPADLLGPEKVTCPGPLRTVSLSKPSSSPYFEAS